MTLTAPLKLAHASGVPFNVNEGQPVGFTGDTIEHLNFFASGAPHGIGGEHEPDGGAAPRARAARDVHGAARQRQRLPRLGAGAERRGRVLRDRSGEADVDADGHVRREASPANDNGDTGGLKYYWDFGDGTTRRRQEGDAHLRVADVGRREARRRARAATDKWGMYRQAVAVDSPSGSAPSTPACGTFSAAERDALLAAAKAAFKAKPAPPDAKEDQS